jgi:ATP-dependent RNA helicase DeaD
MQKTFQEFGFPSILNEALERIGYQTPTPIQEQTIPLALEGKDILGSAQTGTGKTAAFMLPLIAQLIKNPEKTALVLTPTRELAAQVLEFTQKLLGRKSGIESALLIGGEPMFPQLRQLRNRPRIVVGTPGRVNDHITRGTLSLKDTGVFVLDETDRMLDMGFGIQIDAIAGFLPEERQTFMFSATLPAAIIRLTQKYLKNPAQVHINATHAPAANIQQDTINVTADSKFPELLKELEKRAGSVIIFAKTKYGTEKLARSLRDEGHSTDFLHGDLRQNRRNKVVRDFRERKHRILIATDVAARGLDIPHIEHVINYDLPQCPEDYIHRIGRTARAGAKGSSLCLIAPQDRRLWAAIQHMLDPKKNQRPAPERGGRGGGGRGGNGG